MSIGIVAATFWEVRGFLRKTCAKKIDERSYLIQQWNKEIFLFVSGVGKKQVEETTQKLLERSPDLVLCAGFAGSLKPEICPGDLVLDNEKSSRETLERLPALCQSIQISLHQGRFYTSGSLLRTAEEKEKIAKQTGAIAVEMESSAVFDVCSKQGIPSLFVRSISDGFSQTLPAVIAKFNSHESAGKFLGKVLKKPADWIRFVQFLISVRRAKKNLTKFLVEFCKGL